MTLTEALDWARTELAATTETPALDAEVLLTHVSQRQRSYLRAWPEHRLSSDQTETFRQLVIRRREGVPIAYLTGEREFWSRSFKVSPGVLIPRPETELLIELALERVPKNRHVKILDLGTGSGIIAITVALERPEAFITAIDASPLALGIAQENITRLGANRVRLLAGDWFHPLPSGEQYDLILSNPPYIAENDPHLSQHGLPYEPTLALTAGPDGLDALRIITDRARNHLKPGGTLLFEHGFDQAQATYSLLDTKGYHQITQHQDLQGHYRATMARYG